MAKKFLKISAFQKDINTLWSSRYVTKKGGTFDGDFLRYDNHRCEGHHKHIKGQRLPYRFKDLETLLEDFERDFKRLLKEVQK